MEKLFAGKTKRPTLQTVTKLAHLFGCTLDDLQNANFEGQKEIPSAPAATGTERISIEETDKLLAALGFIEEGGELSDDDLLFSARRCHFDERMVRKAQAKVKRYK